MRSKRSLIALILSLFAAAPVLAQGSSGTITGTITDAQTQNPINGVAVSVVGTELGTLTGPDGRYTLNGVPTGVQRVRVATIGHSSQEREVTVSPGQTTSLDFQMVSQALELEGIVAVGYGTQRRRDVTGAVASVDAQEIREIPTANVVDAIKGRVPGVDVVASGYEPGAGVSVRIRGTRSIRAGNEPLYVVDGIPVSRGIRDFNPQDIQSIEVLKDASSTAIYGARGANGVVLITTRQGHAGETSFTYNTYAGAQRIINKVEMFNGEEFAEYKREAYRAEGRYPCPGRTACAEGDEEIFYPAELESIALGRSTDWQEEILQTGLQHSHQLSAEGGNESTRFAGTLNYFDQEGITRSQDYGRQSGSLRLEHTMGRLRVGASTQLSRSTQNLGRGDGLWFEALLSSPLGPARDEDGNMIFQPTPDPLRSNPVADVENWKREIARTRVFGSAFSALELADGVHWRVNFGPDLVFLRNGQFRGSVTNARMLSAADAQQTKEQSFAYTLDNLLTIDRRFGEHAFDLTGLYSIQQERFEWSRAAVSELPYEHQQWYNLGSAGTIQGVGSRLEEWALQSYMARLNYGFRDKYLVTLTGRIDGSSRLAPGNKYATFPSVAAAWHLGAEPFLRDLGLFSDLKLRASYGITGNTAISPYQTQGGLQRTFYALGDRGAYGYGPDDLENPDLEWEKTEQLDVGLDFGVLGNRVSGVIDFYVANTRDLLLLRQLPTATGFSSILENVGQTKNRGLELSLSTLNLDGWHGLTWTTDFSWAMNRNEIVSLYGGREDDVGNRWFIGEPIQVWYDHQFAGIWQQEEEALAAEYNQKPGQIKVVDQNNDGKIGADDRTILGSSYPDWTGSVSSRMGWGPLDFSALVTARQGFMIYDDFNASYNTVGGRFNNIRIDYWTPENPSSRWPQPDHSYSTGPLYRNAQAYTDASFVRVRNLTLGYSVPDALVRRVGGDRLRLYASAQDPFVFTSYEGFDPESGTGAAAPSYRTLLIGADVGF